MKVLTFANWKGGVGRTTSVVNLGAYFARQGKRTLLVDMDVQFNLSQCFGITEPEETIFEALINRTPIPLYEVRENLHLSPSGINGIGADMEMSIKIQIGRTERLKLALEGLDYDVVLIDCPPPLHVPTLNAFQAADYILSPVQAEAMSFKGMGSLDNQIKKMFNVKQGIDYIFLTMVQSNTKLAKRVDHGVSTHFENRFLETKIRRNIDLASAPINNNTIFESGPQSKGAEDYAALGAELIKTLNL